MIDDIVIKSRIAQQAYEKYGSQEIFDSACQAIAWALMKSERNNELSELAVSETGLGNTKDKIKKNHNKTLGLMRDLKGVIAFGHISNNGEKGLSTYFRPKGVIAAVVPSTNPIATPTNNIINALKTGNSIILAPSPKGTKPLERLLHYIELELKKFDLPPNLIQMIPPPASHLKTERLMKLADLVVVTGSKSNVHAGYSSGTPAIGVGVGNVVTIVDETADLTTTAQKIAMSKTFDNSTSCSSENSIIAVEEIYEQLIVSLVKEGGMVLNQSQANALESIHWENGKMTTKILAQDISKILKVLKLTYIAPKETSFLIIPQEGIGPKHPLSGEKMSRFLTIFKTKNFDGAVKKAVEIQDYQGIGHSLGLHSTDDKRAHMLAKQAKSCRIIVNQAHCFATGGFFNNGSPFSLSMGCGSWGGNSIDENLNWEHFINKVNIVREIPENRPSLEDIFSDYWAAHGK
ncbi:MAG: aldehyde dehydrogenase family protein [Paracoccaceae bacterium]|nr:aldehyde dehydrogenase family protein [Paracoccaceae bacterium]MDG2373483.1 aldehyde dehydrogenase family protein [Paracoccaceae bacterium]